MPLDFKMNFRRSLAQLTYALVSLVVIGYLDSLSIGLSQSLLYGMLCLWAGYRLTRPAAVCVLTGCLLVHQLADLGYLQDADHWVQSASEGVLLAIVAYIGHSQRVSRNALLATRARAAKAHSVLLEHLESARQVQLELLGTPPQNLEPYDLGLDFEVAVELGGDLFFVRQVPDGVFLFVGDVSGKGPRAALAATSIRVLLESILRDTFSPAEVMAELQRRFIPLFPGGLFFTAFCAVASPMRNGLVYTSAGHDPPLLRRALQDRLEELGGEAMPVGVDAAESFSETTIDFFPGDRLLVYTDGLSDARQPGGGRLGTEPVEQALLTFQGEGKELARRLVEMAPPPRQDDVMVLVLTFIPVVAQSSALTPVMGSLTEPDLSIDRSPDLAVLEPLSVGLSAE